MRIQNFPTEIDTSFMVYEMEVTCRKVVNQYAFHLFQKPHLHKIACSLNSWNESVKTIVHRDTSLIEVLFWINSWLVTCLCAGSEILSK